MAIRNLIGAIDQGTSSSRFIVFEAQTGALVTDHQEEVEQLFPEEGWIEQRPEDLLQSVLRCIEGACRNLEKENISLDSIKSIGITNQRETTVVWDKLTGKPLNNAVVWCDARNTTTVNNILATIPEETKEKKMDHLRPACGLPLATYFSATKLVWLKDNNEAVKLAMEEDRLMFGTVDTWLIWNLTGGLEGGKHLTDVTNASRTMLMNLKTLAWDQSLVKFFHLKESILPKILPSSALYGEIRSGSLAGKQITGVVGDQQAALLGHGCVRPGQAKNTYGTGCFLLYNTGTTPIDSTSGLLTTVAYQQDGEPATYALEGSVAVAGQAVRWLRDNMGMLKESSEVTTLAEEVDNSGGVYFVPAFSGLFAPHWKSDARGTICGLTLHTRKQHIARAVLEAVCFQTKEIFEAMASDSGVDLQSLLVDGGMTASGLLLQLQADILGIEVKRPKMTEVTALGAAVAAGVGAGVWRIGVEDVEGGKDLVVIQPNIGEEERKRRMERWKMAVERSLGWETE